MNSLVLASASPRRRELLNQIGIGHTVHAVDIDETPKLNESPAALVERLAQQKANAALTQLDNAKVVVLAADTIIEYQGKPLGKPRDEADAIQTLTALSNNTHLVHTAFCVMNDQDCHLETVTSEIKFGQITQQQALAYWQTGEPKDKAGSYAIQGKGAAFVKHLTGSYSAVVGLPLHECQVALQKFGVQV
jgi:septum formation protein